MSTATTEPGSATGPARADLVIRAGQVHLMTGRGDVHRSIAESGSRIVATDADPHGLDELIDVGTTVIDDPALSVFPGFFDTHNHQLLAARDGESVDLDRATSIAELIAAIRDEASRVPAGDWIVTSRSWHESNLAEGRLPNAGELDQATDRHPLLVRRGGHVAVANTAALTLAGITREAPDPERGTVVRDAAGNPTGVMIEAPAFAALEALVPALSVQDQVRLLAAQCARYNAAGITAVRDPGLVPDELEVYSSLQRQGGLSTRTRLLMWAMSHAQAQLAVAAASAAGLDHPMLRIEGLKIVVDGGIEAAALNEPYATNPDFCGHMLVPAAELTEIVELGLGSAWKVACHAVGDRAITNVLDVFTGALQRHPHLSPRRLSLEHGLLASPEQRARAAALGICVTVQHPLLYSLAANMRRYWGDERTALANPIRGWVDSGATVGAGSDCNVAPFNPMLSLAGMTTRETRSAGIQGPDQAIDLYDAIRLYTAAAAHITGDEAKQGRLVPGLRADIVAFTSDPFTLASEELADLTPANVIVDGCHVVGA